MLVLAAALTLAAAALTCGIDLRYRTEHLRLRLRTLQLHCERHSVPRALLLVLAPLRPNARARLA